MCVFVCVCVHAGASALCKEEAQGLEVLRRAIVRWFKPRI